MNPSLNGFFIRDDVPPNFVKNNYEHFNYYTNNGINGVGNPTDRASDTGFTQTFTSGQDTNSSDYIDYLIAVRNNDCLLYTSRCV